MSVARFSWVPNLYNIHFLIENQGSQPDHVNSHPVYIYIYSTTLLYSTILYFILLNINRYSYIFLVLYYTRVFIYTIYHYNYACASYQDNIYIYIHISIHYIIYHLYYISRYGV